MNDLIVGSDGKARPVWAASNDLLREYYDVEWGIPIHTEQELFERLSLEAFQSGLSWSTILRKRPAFREAFANFDPDVVASFTEDDIERLLHDTGIVRNRRKILATVNNAQATVALRGWDNTSGNGDLASFIWSFQPKTTPTPTTLADVPTTSTESVALAKALKKRGFSFVGPTTMFALMEAVGIVDTHLVGSWRRGASGLWSTGGQRKS